MNHGVRSGNWRLALDGARALERQNALLADARYLLVAEAFRAHDWRAAKAQIDAIERDQSLAFTVPVLRAWLAFGSREGDPLAALAAAGTTGPAAGYAAEHRALLLVAMNRPEGQAELLSAARSAGPRSVRLRIAGASLLAQRRQRDAALALFDIDTPALQAARPHSGEPAGSRRDRHRRGRRGRADGPPRARSWRAGYEPARHRLRPARDPARSAKRRSLAGDRRIARPAGSGPARGPRSSTISRPRTRSRLPRATRASACSSRAAKRSGFGPRPAGGRCARGPAGRLGAARP